MGLKWLKLDDVIGPNRSKMAKGNDLLGANRSKMASGSVPVQFQ